MAHKRPRSLYHVGALTAAASSFKRRRSARIASYKKNPQRTKIASKHGGSGSRTITRTKRRPRVIQSPPNGLSKSFNLCKCIPSKVTGLYKKLTQPCIQQFIGTIGVSTTGATGKQISTEFTPMYTRMDLVAQANETLALQNGAVSSNPSGIVSGTGKGNLYKMFFAYGESSTMMTNQEQFTTIVKVYDLKCIRNTNVAPIATWVEGALQQLGANTSGYTGNGVDAPGATPYQSSYFRKYWKILKCTEVELGPGRVHRHTFVHRMNKLVDTSVFSDNGQTIYIAGLSTLQLVVSHGIPGDTLATNAVGTITLTPVKLVCVVNVKYQSRALPITPGVYAPPVAPLDSAQGAAIKVLNQDTEALITGEIGIA